MTSSWWSCCVVRQQKAVRRRFGVVLTNAVSMLAISATLIVLIWDIWHTKKFLNLCDNCDTPQLCDSFIHRAAIHFERRSGHRESRDSSSACLLLVACLSRQRRQLTSSLTQASRRSCHLSLSLSHVALPLSRAPSSASVAQCQRPAQWLPVTFFLIWLDFISC